MSIHLHSFNSLFRINTQRNFYICKFAKGYWTHSPYSLIHSLFSMSILVNRHTLVWCILLLNAFLLHGAHLRPEVPVSVDIYFSPPLIMNWLKAFEFHCSKMDILNFYLKMILNYGKLVLKNSNWMVDFPGILLINAFVI